MGSVFCVWMYMFLSQPVTAPMLDWLLAHLCDSTPFLFTEKLRKHFMLFGEVIDAVVMKDPISRR